MLISLSFDITIIAQPVGLVKNCGRYVSPFAKISAFSVDRIYTHHGKYGKMRKNCRRPLKTVRENAKMLM